MIQDCAAGVNRFGCQYWSFPVNRTRL